MWDVGRGMVEWQVALLRSIGVDRRYDEACHQRHQVLWPERTPRVNAAENQWYALLQKVRGEVDW